MNPVLSKRPQFNRALYHPYSRVSAWRSVALCIGLYLATLFLAWIGSTLSHWWLAPLSILVIAGLQNHLLILLHEGAHRMLHPQARWNDFLTDLFCGIPLLTTVNNYRAFHITHHRYTGKPGQDPEIALYASQDYRYQREPSKGKVLWMFCKDLSGYHSLKFAVSMFQAVGNLPGHRVVTPRDLALNVFFWTGITVAAFYFGFWPQLLVFWILPLLTVTFFFLKLHGYGEHTGLDGPSEFERTWFHDFHWITNFFIYPIYSGYHIEHHLFPMVPWYHMKAFHRELLKEPAYSEVSEKVRADGFFFGKRTIFASMIYGQGFYVDQPEFQQALQARKQQLEHHQTARPAAFQTVHTEPTLVTF